MNVLHHFMQETWAAMVPCISRGLRINLLSTIQGWLHSIFIGSLVLCKGSCTCCYYSRICSKSSHPQCSVLEVVRIKEEGIAFSICICVVWRQHNPGKAELKVGVQIQQTDGSQIGGGGVQGRQYPRESWRTLNIHHTSGSTGSACPFSFEIHSSHSCTRSLDTQKC